MSFTAALGPGLVLWGRQGFLLPCRWRFLRLRKRLQDLLAKLRSDLPQRRFVEGVHSSCQSTLPGDELHSPISELQGSAQDEVAHHDDALRMVGGGGHAEESLLRGAYEHNVLRGHPGQVQQSAGGCDEFRSQRGSQQGRKVRRQAGHTTLQVQENVTLAVIEHESLVCRNHHLVQLLPWKHCAGRHGGRDCDGHHRRVGENVREIDGGEVLGVADALHHLEVIQGAHNNGLQLRKFLGVDIPHEAMYIKHLVIDLADKRVTPCNQRVLRIFFGELLAELQRRLLIFPFPDLVHELLELVVLEHL
mmetsp:Transcript_33135/g.72212  ORF Transcript_33135/g.72212 Transcript_33135/m.72212 type:complete len:305 (-) Transcript_33135:228-1142(-)